MVYFRNGYMPQNYQSEEVASHCLLFWLGFRLEPPEVGRPLLHWFRSSLVGLGSSSSDGALPGCEMS